MIVYLSDNQNTELGAFLKESNIELWQKPQDSGNIANWDQIGMNPLERVDGLILEITKVDPQMNYLIAQAILLHINTLCLYKKSAPPRQLLMYLHKKNVPKSIVTKAYTENNIKEISLKFLKAIRPHIQLEETPHIKYTLRLTDSIERYLNWKSKNIKINKADYIRDLIQKLARDDKEYQRWLKDIS